MVVAIDPDATFDHVLREERDSAEPTVFKLKPLTARQLAQIEDMLVVHLGGGVRLNTGMQTLEVLRLGLVGWENFKDAAGNPVPFVPITPKDERSLDLLHPRWRVELANAVTEHAKLTEEQRKNSGSERG
jgi:hypothetical protein